MPGLLALEISVSPASSPPAVCDSSSKCQSKSIKTEFQLLGWKDEGLSLLAKGHPMKVQLARRLRRETILSLKWIASRLRMGSWSYVSNLLAQPPKAQTVSQNALPLFP